MGETVDDIVPAEPPPASEAANLPTDAHKTEGPTTTYSAALTNQTPTGERQPPQKFTIGTARRELRMRAKQEAGQRKTQTKGISEHTIEE